MDYAGRLIAGIMALILIAVFPLQYIAQSNSDSIDTLVDERTRAFSEEVRSRGYLDIGMYEDYMKFLDTTGELYDLTIEDIHPVAGEEHEHASISNAGRMVPASLSSRAEGISTQCSHAHMEDMDNHSCKQSLQPYQLTLLSHDKTYKSADKRLISEPDSVSKVIKSFASHTHTGDCYAGDLHVCDGTHCQYAPGSTEIVAISFNQMNSSVQTLYSSIDQGATWRNITMPSYVRGLTYGSNGFLLLDGEQNGNNSVKSYNPITGSLTTTYNYAYLKKLFYAQDKYFVIFDDSNSGYKIGCSTDGTSFTYSDSIINGAHSDTFRNIIYGNGKYYALNNYYSTYNEYKTELLISNDGISWTRQCDAAATYSDIVYAGDRLIRLHEAGGLQSSINDGLTWTTMNNPYYDSQTANRLLYNNGILIVQTSFHIYYSSNMGTSWQMAPNYVGNNSKTIFCDDIVYNACKINFTGPLGLYKSTNFSNWSIINLSGTNSNYLCSFMACNAYGGSGDIDKGPCLKTGKYYNSSGNEVLPICNQVVTSITPTNPTQTVVQGNPIITTATATYLDGHTGTVNCTSNFNTDRIGTQTVTLTYSGLVGNARTAGTRTCTVSVTVNSSVVLSSLMVIPSATTVNNGTEPSYTIIAYYSNGTQKIITGGYTKTGWSSGPGTKTVTFSYTENGRTVSATVIITVLPNVSTLTVTASSTTVYNGTEPAYTVRLNYENGTSKVITSGYTKNGWSSGPGTKTVTFSYTENGKTVSNYVIITVLPNILYISVMPASQEVERYMPPPAITVTGFYEDGSSKALYNYSTAGYNPTLLGSQTVTITYIENNITRNATITIIVIPVHRTCPHCGTRYSLDANDYDNGCPVCRQSITRIEVSPANVTTERGMPLNIKVTAFYGHGHSEEVFGWTSDYDSSRLGLQTVTVEYGGYSAEVTVYINPGKITCPICDSRYSESEGSCPYCSERVISINAAPNILTIVQYEALSLTVTAYYADGSSRSVDEWSIDRTSEAPGTYDATVSYRGKDTAITLIVIPLTAVQCPICALIYEPAANPRGCPVCSNELTGIEVYFNSGSNRVQLGAFPDIALILIYRDEHRELMKDGYEIANYASDKLGSQIITVQYKSFHIEIEVEVIDALKSVTCRYGHIYYLNEDMSDPGCPYCAASEGMSTVYYYDITYTFEILDAVYKDGAYYFKKGNYITFTVTKRNRSINYNLQNTFFRTAMLGTKKRYIYGGGVY